MNTKQIQIVSQRCNSLKSFIEIARGYRELELKIGNGVIERKLDDQLTKILVPDIITILSQQLTKQQNILKELIND